MERREWGAEHGTRTGMGASCVRRVATYRLAPYRSKGPALSPMRAFCRHVSPWSKPVHSVSSEGAPTKPQRQASQWASTMVSSVNLTSEMCANEMVTWSCQRLMMREARRTRASFITRSMRSSRSELTSIDDVDCPLRCSTASTIRSSGRHVTKSRGNQPLR